MVRQSTYLRRILKEAIRQGWSLDFVDNGGDEDERVPVTTPNQAVKECKAVDCAHVFLRRAADPDLAPPLQAEQCAWIFVVWQGPDDKYPEGEEIASDYTVNLNSVFEALEGKKV